MSKNRNDFDSHLSLGGIRILIPYLEIPIGIFNYWEIPMEIFNYWGIPLGTLNY